MLEAIKASNIDFDYVVTMPCGGLMPSYYVAKELDLPVRTVNITSYDDGEQGELKIWAEDRDFTIADTDRVLVVDDIYDSGRTMAALREFFPHIKTAATYARWPSHTLDFIGEILNHETFVDFPWEVRFDGQDQQGTVG